MKEMMTEASPNSDEYPFLETDIGTGPPDYTSISPVKYGCPGSKAKVAGDSDADRYYIAEDIGTATGERPK